MDELKDIFEALAKVENGPDWVKAIKRVVTRGDRAIEEMQATVTTLGRTDVEEGVKALQKSLKVANTARGEAIAKIDELETTSKVSRVARESGMDEDSFTKFVKSGVIDKSLISLADDGTFTIDGKKPEEYAKGLGNLYHALYPPSSTPKEPEPVKATDETPSIDLTSPMPPLVPAGGTGSTPPAPTSDPIAELAENMGFKFPSFSK
jgi:hypothetical protein